MSLKGTASNKGGQDYEVVPAGTHRAITVALIDLGTHKDEYQGKATENRKVFFVWELPELTIAGTKGSRQVIGREFNFTLGEKANLRKFLEGWRAKPYGEGEDVDLAVFKGKPCMLTILNKTANSGNQFAVVNTANQPDRDVKIGKPLVTPFVWELDAGKPAPTDAWIPHLYSKVAGKMVPVHEYIANSKEAIEAFGQVKPATPTNGNADKPKHSSGPAPKAQEPVGAGATKTGEEWDDGRF